MTSLTGRHDRTAFRTTRLFAAGCALVFLLGHLPFLASSLEDVDSVNFALGLRDFDVAAHRPHPPGYPVFIAVGKVVRMAVAGVLPAGSAPDVIDARTLALIGVVAGALLAFPLLQFFRMLEQHEARARAALAFTLASPLLWFNASRPLSDTAGLLASITVQALLLTAWRRQRSQAEDPSRGADRDALVASGRLIVLGALLAGFAIGVRSQTVWLTFPVLVLVIADRAGRGAAGALLGASITFSIGVVLWAVPLLIATGGPTAYWRALTGQAGEDLSGVDLLARNPTVRRFVSGLGDTFVDPWVAIWLVVPVIVLAVVGAVALLRRSGSAFTMLVIAALPYAAFHLTFQETFTTRYALPLVPVLGYLVVRGLSVAGERVMLGGMAALVVACLTVTMPAVAAYSSQGSPVARAVADVREGLARYSPKGRALMMNHPFSIALRDDTFDAERLPSARRSQWLEMTKYWLAGGARPVWFLAEPGPNGLDRHHELTLIDPSAQTLRRAYRWPFDPTGFVGGARPSEVDWHELRPPGWFALQGWALTPELAGAARLTRHGPASSGGITAYVRRRPDASVVVLGGRNLGRADAPDVRFDLAIDGRPVKAWRARAMPGFFFDLWTLEAGQLDGAGAFATLTITAEAADGSGLPVEAAIEQFDIQAVSGVVWGFDSGWHEQEYSPVTGLLWRWSTEQASIRIHGNGGPVRLRVRGEAPGRYFDGPSVITVRAGTRVLAEERTSTDYTLELTIPPDALAAAGGVVTVGTNQTFVPHERTGNGDRRRLGLRILELRVSAENAHAR